MAVYKHKYAKSIYDMDLNEELIEIGDEEADVGWGELPIHILRVPGGWIYYHTFLGSRDGTFVPFSSEFRPGQDTGPR